MLPNPLHFDQICRICLSNSEQLINFFNTEENIMSLLVSMTAISMSQNDELPQNICPFCLHQIKTTYYFILKCQESDQKLRLSLTNSSVKESDTVNADDDFIDDNEVCEFECIANEESNVQIVEEENELNQAITVLQSENEAKDELSSGMARQLDDNSEMIPVLENETIAQPKPTKTENICSICNKTFLKRKSLERHKAMHEKDKTNDTTYQCTVCGKQMKHINHFKIHMRSHRGGDGGNDTQNISSNPMPSENSNKKKYLCSTCGRACTSQSNLAVHIRRHTGTMTNFCKVCGKGYPRSTDLTIHMRKHTGERPFVCSICCRCFARSDKLTIHVRTHTGERPYTCTGCSRSFAQRNDLLTHQRRNVCGSSKLKKDTASTSAIQNTN